MPTPGRKSATHRALEQWFAAGDLRPRIVAEVDDSAQLELQGEAGLGAFAAWAGNERSARRRYRVEVVGRAGSLRQRLYAINCERCIRHPSSRSRSMVAKRSSDEGPRSGGGSHRRGVQGAGPIAPLGALDALDGYTASFPHATGGHIMSVTQANHVRWDDLPRERLSERLERRFVTGQHLTLAQFFLARGCIVPRHSHDSEQFTHVLQGRLRLRLGAEGTETVEVGAGEVLHLPSGLPHDAEALEDTVVVDAFSPIRGDWLERRDDYLRR